MRLAWLFAPFVLPRLSGADNAADYAGAREADAIVSFMKKYRRFCRRDGCGGVGGLTMRALTRARAWLARGPCERGTWCRQVSPALTAVQETDLANFADSDKVVVVGFFKSTADPEYDRFLAVAQLSRDFYTFGAVIDEDSSSALAAGTTVPGIVLYKKFDERKNVYAGEIVQDDVTSFIRANAVPLMDDIGPDNYQTYAESGLPIAYLFVGSDADRASVGPAVENVAKGFKGRVNFVYLDAAKYGGHANNVNLKQQWPAFAIQLPMQNLKFPFDQSKAITEEAINAFVTDFVEDKLVPSLKSEEAPANQDGPVFVLVGKQFNEVINSKKDVFVEFYAPWCGHCKNLAPIWDELGGKVAGNSKIVVAKMDATANDIPPETGIAIQGFPTLKLFRADGQVVDFDGDRTLDSMLSFLKKNSVNGGSISLEDGDDDDDTPAGKSEL